MRDLCEKTGRWISGEDLVRQKISRILLTQKGSKPVLRSFGSDLRRFVGLPLREFKAHATQEVFQKLEMLVPEFKCDNVEFSGLQYGKVQIIITGSTDKKAIDHVIST